MKSTFAFGVISLGVLLLILSGIWVSMFSGKGSFTEEKSKHWSKVKDRINNLAFIVNVPAGAKMHSGPDLGQAKAELEQLKAENEQLTAEFSGAYDTPRTTAKFLKWAGISFAAVGIIGWYAANQSR